jgi:hypothetical protein
MLIRMTMGTVVLLADPEGVAYRIERTMPEAVRGGELPTGPVASGVAPRVCDVAALVVLLFGEMWAVN